MDKCQFPGMEMHRALSAIGAAFGGRNRGFGTLLEERKGLVRRRKIANHYQPARWFIREFDSSAH